MINYTSKKYTKNNENFTYVEYDDNGQVYTNAEFYLIDLGHESVKTILSHAGGFCANIMSRIIAEKGFSAVVQQILFAATPRETNQFEFVIIYLDAQRSLVFSQIGDNYFDFSYFKNKFSEGIVQSGFVYELLNETFYESMTITKNSSVLFGVSLLDSLTATELDEAVFLLNDITASGLNFTERVYKFFGESKSNQMLLRFKHSAMEGHVFQFGFICEDYIVSSFLFNHYGADISKHIDAICAKLELSNARNVTVLKDEIEEMFEPHWFNSLGVNTVKSLEEKGLVSILPKEKYNTYLEVTKTMCDKWLDLKLKAVLM